MMSSTRILLRPAAAAASAAAAAAAARDLPPNVGAETQSQQLACGLRRSLPDGASGEYAECVQTAVQLVGRPTAHFSLEVALEGEWKEVSHQVKELVTQRPLVLRALRDCSDSGLPAGSIRGLLVLLVSKALGRPRPPGTTKGPSEELKFMDILSSQRKLAEVAELCHVICMMHQTVVNSLVRLESREPNKSEAESAHDELNKVAILCGDFLMASVLNDVSKFKNSKVYALVVGAIIQISQSVFYGLDPASIDANNVLKSWKEKNVLAIGSGISNHCQGALLLGGNEDEANHALVSLFGKHVGLAWQAKQELEEFIEYSASSDGGRKLNYRSLPLLVHLQQTQAWDKISAMDAAEERDLVQEVLSAGYGIRGSLEVIEEHSLEAQRLLLELPPCDARDSLLRIVQTISNRVTAPSKSISLAV